MPVAGQAQVLVCGVAEGFPPYQYVGIGGQAAGLDVEVATLVFHELGIPFQFRQRPWVELYLGLAHRTGEVEVLCGAEVNAERLTQLTFSRGYYQREVAIFVLGDSPYQSAKDLSGRPVTGDWGGVIETLVAQYRLRVLAADTKELAFQRLKTGEVQAVMAPVEVGRWIAAQKGLAVRTLPERDRGSPVAFAVAKGNLALAARITDSLNRLEHQGKIEAIVKKYR